MIGTIGYELAQASLEVVAYSEWACAIGLVPKPGWRFLIRHPLVSRHQVDATTSRLNLNSVVRLLHVSSVQPADGCSSWSFSRVPAGDLGSKFIPFSILFLGETSYPPW